MEMVTAEIGRFARKHEESLCITTLSSDPTARQ
jgi:hypothetical protein